VTATTNHRHGLTDEVRSRVKCAVRLTDDDGTHAGDNPWLSPACAVRQNPSTGHFSRRVRGKIKINFTYFARRSLTAD